MALSDKQYEALVKQLEAKKARLGETEYQGFISRVGSSTESVQRPDQGDGIITDVAQGFAKSAGSLALGTGMIGRSIQKGISAVGDKLLGSANPFKTGPNQIFDKGSTQNTSAKQLLTPNTTAEKVGSFAGDVASFAVPGMAVAKASKGANFLTRAASLGLSDGAVTTVKQGEVNKESIDAAIIGAAFPVAGKAFGAAKSAILPSGKEAGGRVINSLIKPLLKDFSYGKNPGQAVAEAGITANTLDELATNIRVVRQAVGEEIASKVKTSTTRFDASDALTSIDEALVNAQKSPRTNREVIRRLQDVRDDLLLVGDDGAAGRNLKDISADELWSFNKDIGELARWTGNASDDEIVNKAVTKAYSATRSKLNEGVKGIDDISEKYANLKSAETATEYRDKIASRQNLISFSGTQLGTAAAVTTAIVSGGAVMPILIGAGAALGTEALKSPAAKTRVAAWLATASKDEVKKAFTDAPWLRSTLQASLFGEDEGLDEPSK